MKYKNFQDFIMKNPDKIYFMELRESQNMLIAETSNDLIK